MSVYNKRGILLLPKVIVLNPKDGYLKGLRYNEHLRPRSALIEVGAQTNTFEEAKNAMEPLAELLDMVLQGN